MTWTVALSPRFSKDFDRLPMRLQRAVDHTPGGRDDARTKANVVCFNTESPAKAGGYTAAQY